MNLEELKNRLCDDHEGKTWPKETESMIGNLRMSSLHDNLMSTKNIEGDVMETGIWRGGACIFMSAYLKSINSDKKVYACDSFEGLPKPEIKEDEGDVHYTYDNLKVGLEEVKNNFKKYDLLDDRTIFIKGWFKDTMPILKNEVKNLSLLRLDGDMYKSTIDVLENMYFKVSKGGIVIIDDWALNAKNAVIDFREKYNIANEIHEIDWTGRYWVV